MFAEIANLACDADPNSATSVTFDWLAVGRVLGLRVAKYVQTTQSQVDAYEYASGNKVIKAFIPTDWSFFNEKGRLMTIDDLLKGTHVTPKKLKWTVHHFSCRRQESSHLSGACSTSNLPARKASRSI